MRKHFFPTLILALLALIPTAAHGHAFLDYAEPKVGSTIEVAPHCVKIWFTEGLNHTQSKISVFDSSGNEVDKKDSTVDAGNRSQMMVSLPALPEGTYRVAWSAVAVDTHHTQGTFTFTIKRP
jgi:methionine-rich copper-binding protein CopC